MSCSLLENQDPESDGKGSQGGGNGKPLIVLEKGK